MCSVSSAILLWWQSRTINLCAISATIGPTIAKGTANGVSRHDQEAVSGYIFSIVVDVPAYNKITTIYGHPTHYFIVVGEHGI